MTALKSQIEELVGPAIQVNDEVIRACQEKNEFGGLSFALYREATGLIWVTSNAFYQTIAGSTMTRSQAVCMGLLSRTSKLMASVLKLSSEVEHGETAQILDRCILESSIDLQYLLKKNDDDLGGTWKDNGPPKSPVGGAGETGERGVPLGRNGMVGLLRLAIQWLPYESVEFEVNQAAFDALGMRDYIWRYPRGSYIQKVV